MKQEWLVRNAVAAIRELKTGTGDPIAVRGFPGAGVLKEAGIFTDYSSPQWMVAAREELQKLLTPEEWEGLRCCGLYNSHYTQADVIRQMWRLCDRLVDRPPKVLDVGCGTLGFFTAAPDLAQPIEKYVGVEKDLVTGQLAKAIAQRFPNVEVHQADFLEWEYHQKFDLMVGNIPFVDASHKPLVVSGRKLQLGLHAKILARALTMLNQGGIVCILTTTNLLDSAGGDGIWFRVWLEEYLEFLGAVRMPGSLVHFGKTEVATDLVVFRKRGNFYRKQLGNVAPWTETQPSDIISLTAAKERCALNCCFDPDPYAYTGLGQGVMLGEICLDKLTRAKVGLQPVEGLDFQGSLRDACDAIAACAAGESVSFALNITKSSYGGEEMAKNTVNVVPAEKFRGETCNDFVAIENPKKRGVEIHFHPNCQLSRSMQGWLERHKFKICKTNTKMWYTSLNENPNAIATVENAIANSGRYNPYWLDCDDTEKKTTMYAPRKSNGSTPEENIPQAEGIAEEFAELKAQIAAIPRLVVEAVQEASKDVRELREANQRLEANVLDLKVGLDAKTARIQELEEERDRLKAGNQYAKALKEERDRLQEELEAIRKERTELERECDRLETELEAQQRANKMLAKAASTEEDSPFEDDAPEDSPFEDEAPDEAPTDNPFGDDAPDEPPALPAAEPPDFDDLLDELEEDVLGK